ncbi:MAG: helix-turn-helix transcriptional regulator [Clostridiales bacterium]|nr:helix-turn-helix transcriptional regulator [Clostridiales bacterium]
MRLDDIAPNVQRVQLFRIPKNSPEWEQPKCSYQYRLMFVTEGSPTLVCGKEVYACDTDSLIFWAPGTWYSVGSSDVGDVCVITVFFDFDKTRLGINVPATPCLPSEYDDEHTGERVCFEDSCVFGDQFHMPSAKFLRPLFTRLLSTRLLRNKYCSLACDAQLTLILLDIQRYAESTNIEPPDASAEELLSYLRQAAVRRVGCGELAAELGYSHSWLNRIVKRHTGMPMKDFLLLNKVRLAEDLLRYTPRTLTDIALSLGFSDSSHFIRTFSRFNGSTPAKYRQEFRQ